MTHPATTTTMTWPERRNAIRESLIADGMRPDVAEEGAYWLIAAAASSELNLDHYAAEATLAGAGVMPPARVGQRWSRLRPGDFGSPGTR